MCCCIVTFYAVLPTKSESGDGSQSVTLVNHPGGRQWSRPLIPEMCFNTQTSKMTEGGEGQLSNPHLAEDGTSRLVSCRQCLVRVHTSKWHDGMTLSICPVCNIFSHFFNLGPIFQSVEILSSRINNWSTDYFSIFCFFFFVPTDLFTHENWHLTVRSTKLLGDNFSSSISCQ